MGAWLVRLVGIGLLCSCVEVGVEHCADGTTCAAGTSCGVPSGCVAAGDCGDGVVSTGEICDDGNLASGDGCSADCASLEQCGNAVVDQGQGETCDDANRASHDGCSSGCLLETPTWQAGVTPVQLSARVDAAVVWEPDFGRAILHGGKSREGTQPIFDDVWFWDASGWSVQAPQAIMPPALYAHAIASDGAGTTVMFGGESVANSCMFNTRTNCDECWVWNGVAWSTCVGTLPLGMLGRAMATGPSRTIVLFDHLFGGATWEWAANAWTSTAATGPLNSLYPAMAFDAVGRRSVMAGGGSNFSGWAWQTGMWTQSVSEVARLGHAMTYNPDRRRVSVVGGQLVNSPSTALPNDIRELEGADWRTVPASPGPTGRTGANVFYDPIRHAFVVFGGLGAGVTLGDTWLLRWESATPDDACDGTDADADGLAGCEDPDCWARCTPRCLPGTTCDDRDPRCGDLICNPNLEDPALCPSDC